jgi:hypothetical protein
MSDFKKCEKGHYYQGENCPYCPSEIPKDNTFFDSGVEDDITYAPGFGPVEPLIGGVIVGEMIGYYRPPLSGKIGKETIIPGLTHPYRPNGGGLTRKLVGFLISYTLDPLGMYFPLYEGRNLIGRDNDCKIVVDDLSMSYKHATLLFKNNIYHIKDELSTNGTFINNEDIFEEVCKLNDGDIIRMGNTTFKFITSL